MEGNFLANSIKKSGNDFISGVFGGHSNSLKIQNLRESIPFRDTPILLNDSFSRIMFDFRADFALCIVSLHGWLLVLLFRLSIIYYQCFSNIS